MNQPTLERTYFVVQNLMTGECLPRPHSDGSRANTPALYEGRGRAKQALSGRRSEMTDVSDWRAREVMIVPVAEEGDMHAPTDDGPEGNGCGVR